jgi:site-specific DNA-methyltransferase (cytosine-N4-specific)
LKAREVLPPTSTTQDAVLGDSRKGLPQSAPHPRAPRLFDGIITSPPYATALPYIDTQRLSLAFLGLSNSTMLGKLEEGLIGAREICARERRAEEHAIAEGSGTLPEDVVRLCRRALALASSTEDGFRRKNVAALLFRYFRDMNAVFASMLPLVRPGGFLAALVGPNKTTLGGQEIEIGTPSLLAAVAESVGWTCQEIAPLDAYQRFDMHRSNSITSEALVVLQRKAMTVRKGRTASRRPPQRPSPGWRT